MGFKYYFVFLFESHYTLNTSFYQIFKLDSYLAYFNFSIFQIYMFMLYFSIKINSFISFIDFDKITL